MGGKADGQQAGNEEKVEGEDDAQTLRACHREVLAASGRSQASSPIRGDDFDDAQRIPVSHVTLTVKKDLATTVACGGSTWQPCPGPGALAAAVTR